MYKTLKEQLLKSETGKELFSQITEIYDECKTMIEIYEAYGRQFDNLEIMIDDIALQLFPQTATWGLALWEKRFKLPTNVDEDYNERRKKLMAKIQSKVTINPETMAAITKSFTGAEIEVLEWIKEYTFGIMSDVEYISKAVEINRIIKHIKPSHMAFLVMFSLAETKSIYIGAITTVGIIHTLLPYDLEDINITVNTNLFGATTHIISNISIE